MIKIGYFIISIAIAFVLVNFNTDSASFADGCCDVKQASDTSAESCKVCGKAVDSKGGRVEVEVEGKNVPLCCKGCANAYKENPDKYSQHEKKQESYRDKYQKQEPQRRQRGEGYY